MSEMRQQTAMTMPGLPTPETVLACLTCGEAAGYGYMVYERSEASGPLYECRRCGRFDSERQCSSCGQFARRVGDFCCPMQGEDEPDVRHDIALQEVCRCPVCVREGNEIQWFGPDEIAEHLREHRS